MNQDYSPGRDKREVTQTPPQPQVPPEERQIEIKDPPTKPQRDPGEARPGSDAARADTRVDTEWERPYQDSPGPDTLAQTPEPFAPERKHDSPGKAPVNPPAEPPNPNPIHIPPGSPNPGDLPGSNPDVVSRRIAGDLKNEVVGEEALNEAGSAATVN